MSAMNENNNFNEIREKFFNFLLKKPCTFKQAEEYLSRCKISDEHKDSLLNEAENISLIDDAAYAKLFVDGHLTWGNLKIIYELSRRGVSRENIYKALEEAENENFRAYELFENWKKSGLDDRKIINRLLSRGFSQKAAKSVFDF